MTGVLTYLVNGIENKSENNQNELIPYSMISAIEPGKVKFLDKGWKDDQIALNQWAANDLNASLGDSITVSFYTVGERRKLIESSREFVLGKILPCPLQFRIIRKANGRLGFPVYQKLSLAENGIPGFQSFMK